VTDPATEISLNDARDQFRPLYGDDVANGIEVGDEMEFPKPTEVLGRIAAQTAKQVIFQKVREAERENIFAEYNQRVGEVVNGTVKRFENGDIIIEVGRIEAVLPRKEQSRAESYAPQDRARTVIKGVNRSAKGPQIVLSRTDPALLIKLFEQEVPEIYDGTVMIRGAVREAGDRAKVAVFSRERDVDPVGACVGMKGTRVQSIIRELRGEKIDIVEWSEDPIAFVTNALSPAKVQRVSIVDDRERVMEVIVEDKQLSLAIGKKGQNVRLAAKLTGWRIDIKSEEEKRREVEAQFEGLETAAESGETEPATPETADGIETAPAEDVAASAPAEDVATVPYTLTGVGEKTVRKLVEAGFATREAVAGSTVEDISQIPGIGEKTAEKILAAARGEPTESTADA
jgi:N utilization substance protein A